MMNDIEEKALTPADPYRNTDGSSEQEAGCESNPGASGSEAAKGAAGSCGNAAPPPPAQRPLPPSWRPVRRVGTITMGLSLIAAGVLILCGLLIPNFNLVSAAKFAPLILVFLGVEILFRYFSSKGEKLKYDFLSGFVCFVLIVASVTVSVIPSLLQYYGPQHRIAENRMEQLVYDDLCDKLSGNGNVSFIEANVYLLEGQPLNFQVENLTDEQLKALKYDYFNVNFHMVDKFEDKNAFAAACSNILSAVQDLNYPLRNLHFFNDSFSLEISRQLATSVTVEDLALQVDDTAWEEAEMKNQYQEGYQQGLEEGDTSGYERGYEQGHAEGYDAGMQEGRDAGYSEGYSDGLSEGQPS